MDANEGDPRVDEAEGAPGAHVVDAEDAEVVVVVVVADADKVAANSQLWGSVTVGYPGWYLHERKHRVTRTEFGWGGYWVY